MCRCAVGLTSLLPWDIVRPANSRRRASALVDVLRSARQALQQAARSVPVVSSHTTWSPTSASSSACEWGQKNSARTRITEHKATQPSNTDILQCLCSAASAACRVAEPFWAASCPCDLPRSPQARRLTCCDGRCCADDGGAGGDVELGRELLCRRRGRGCVRGALVLRDAPHRTEGAHPARSTVSDSDALQVCTPPGARPLVDLSCLAR